MQTNSDRMRLKCQLSSSNGGESTAYNGGLSSFFFKRTKNVFLWIKNKKLPAGAPDLQEKKRRFGRAGLLNPTPFSKHLTQTYTDVHKESEVKTAKVKFFSVAVGWVYLHFNLDRVLKWDDPAWYVNAWEHWKWPEEQCGPASWGTTPTLWNMSCQTMWTVFKSISCVSWHHMHACTHTRVQQQHRHVAVLQTYPKH